MAEDEDITDLIKEIDSDEPPTQSEDPQQTSDPKEKLASYCHWFSLYQKSAYFNQASSNSQLAQFKSFVWCLKSADTTAQILPIRSDIKYSFNFNIQTIKQIRGSGPNKFF
jgi:hypothetical protein